MHGYIGYGTISRYKHMEIYIIYEYIDTVHWNIYIFPL